MRRALSFLLCLLLVVGFAACGQTAPAETAEPLPTADDNPAPTADEAPKASPAVADASQMTTVEKVVEEGMTPVCAESLIDGDYPVEVKSSSSMFRIDNAVLHVKNGAMTATMTMSGKSYLYVFHGTALEADASAESDRIPYVEDENGAYSFTLPVEALDAPIPCAAFSKNKELWYDRTLLFRADSLPQNAFREGFFTTAESLGLADGEYTVSVTLSGGSGRASLQSPCRIRVENGACTAEVVWGSSNYDYMRVDDKVYLPLNTEGNSTFEIPVAYFDRGMPVIADTTAMSQPHEVTYMLRFDSGSIAEAE